MCQLTETQACAINLLKAAGGSLDYQPDQYGFAAPGASRDDRIQMVTAKALVARGLAVASKTKQLRRKTIIDRLTLA